ncbi:transporter substrate-binding domain-containing protein [Methylocystis sp.]|uniref:transporter substrate-binding domain-containing protein n=1 Tax=Methylocystis sp. TaxID=1911079 RepID=UPI0027360C22|nr:transporter substrate-binding domain-containing protein [Methylocystis sp.]MDP3068444.1 transporter substrate-binding domain-containing protein [Methylocystis sp.]MDP3555363.1 transporter substrate-binding domain-containing protein [Methylocystis sp.]
MMIKINILISTILACLAIVVSTPACPETSSAPAKKMQVVVLESPPFVMKTDQGFTGFAIDLWEESAKRMGLDFEYREASTLQELLDSVTTGKSDVAVTELTINAERMERMDFSQPWFDAGLQMMIHQAPPAGFWSFFEQLEENGHLRVYLWMGLGVIVASFLLTALDRRLDPEFPAEWKQGFSESFYHVLSVLTSGKTNHKPVFGSYGTMIAGIWLVMGAGVVAYITSSITSVMTVNSLERRMWVADKGRIEDLADLKGKIVGTLSGSVANMYVAKAGLSGRGFSTLGNLVNALAENRVDAIVGDQPSLVYHLHQHPDLPVIAVGKVVRHEKYGFALKAGSPIRLKLSKQVMLAWETGLIDRLRKKYLGG